MKTYIYPGSGLKISENMSELVEQMKKTPEKMKPIIKKFALLVQSEAARDAPVDTGALKNSLAAKEIEPLSWIVEDGVEYGIYQELGHGYGVVYDGGGDVVFAKGSTAAKHFLGGAVERNADKFFDEIKEALKP